jgi:hypothetical protein
MIWSIIEGRHILVQSWVHYSNYHHIIICRAPRWIESTGGNAAFARKVLPSMKGWKIANCWRKETNISVGIHTLLMKWKKNNVICSSKDEFKIYYQFYACIHDQNHLTVKHVWLKNLSDHSILNKIPIIKGLH